MQFTQLAAVMALMFTAASAGALPEVFERNAEPGQLYCCGFGKRGEYSARCCKASVEVRAAEALALVERNAEPGQLYCCGFGRRGELNTACC